MTGGGRPRVIVTASRRHSGPESRRLFYTTLDTVYRQTGPLIIVHGAARGGDQLAGDWVTSRRGWGWQVDVEEYPADWEGPCRPQCARPHPDGHAGVRGVHPGGSTYCPAAGAYRNRVMGDLDGVAGFVAFPLPGSKGTHDMAGYCRSKGIPELPQAA